ncbi:MAG: peptide-methionine (S)-S-oxide reductase MsrA [Thermodesulfobacteriota bacteirum]|nr:peptide-methionine (S)-S-oxide reductase MsrA [Thermodesulfobacteriota bacterium]
MSNLANATFGAGCFWGVENKFMNIKGVEETSVGYMGSKFKNPTYFDVCSGLTGHAEVVMIKFDQEIINFMTLCNFFFEIHDSTTLNRQGPDVGTQYRSVIFYYNLEQMKTANNIIADFHKNNPTNPQIVTDVVEAMDYYLAEDYHQKYILKNNLESCGG